MLHKFNKLNYLCGSPIILNTMKTGKVKFFNEQKGFGFIVPEDGGKDVFVHSSGLVDRISEGDTVQFEVQDGPKGLNAVNVKKA